MTDDGPASGDEQADGEEDAQTPDHEDRASEPIDPVDGPGEDAEREAVEGVESADKTVDEVEAGETNHDEPEPGSEREGWGDDGSEVTGGPRDSVSGSGGVTASRPDVETSAESTDAGGSSRRDEPVGQAGEATAVATEEPRDESDTGDAASGTGIDRGDADDMGAGAEGARPGDDPSPGDEQFPNAPAEPDDDVPEDVRSYDRFQKVDRASYDRVNEFLRDRMYITAREWAIARLCADFRTATGVEMTKIGENLPELVPFMTDTYSPQAVNQARSAFENKVRMAGATFLYGAMSGFFTADELDELMYEVTEVSKFLLEVEGVELTVDEELDAEDRISAVMREVRQASEELRYDEVACPHCGEAFRPASED